MCEKKNIFEELNESVNNQVLFDDSSKIPVKGKGKLCSGHEEQSPQLRTTTGEGIYHPYGISLPLYQRLKEEANCKSSDDEEVDVPSKFSS